jgi:hypothetical protein
MFAFTPDAIDTSVVSSPAFRQIRRQPELSHYASHFRHYAFYSRHYFSPATLILSAFSFIDSDYGIFSFTLIPISPRIPSRPLRRRFQAATRTPAAAAYAAAAAPPRCAMKRDAFRYTASARQRQRFAVYRRFLR